MVGAEDPLLVGQQLLEQAQRPSPVSTLAGRDILGASTTITGLTDTADLSVGEIVAGANIPAGTTVASIIGGGEITISAPATGSASSESRRSRSTPSTTCPRSSGITASRLPIRPWCLPTMSPNTRASMSRWC